jgi:hypothetical protein
LGRRRGADGRSNLLNVAQLAALVKQGSEEIVGEMQSLEDRTSNRPGADDGSR